MSWLISLLFLLLGSAAAADDMPIVSVEQLPSGVAVSSTILLPGKPCTNYALLTDYDALPRFIPGLVHSTQRRLAPNKAVVTQAGEVQVLFFKVQVSSQLEMDETPDRRIEFRQIAGDLASYDGSWNLSQRDEDTLLEYKARLAFKGYVPFFLAKSILMRDSQGTFQAIAREAALRQQQGTPQCAGDPSSNQ